MRDVLAAEWIKLRTAPSTRYLVGVVVLFAALMLLVGACFVSTWEALPPERRAASSLGSLSELMGWITSLCMAVFGALSMASEHASGMIHTTFIAMPRRTRVLAAKALVVAAGAFVATGAALIVVHLGTGLIVGDRPIAGQAPPGVEDLVLLVAMGLVTTMFALIGLALGSITRSALASVTTLALVWYVAPLLAQHVPEPLAAWLGSLLPGALAGQLAGTGNANSVFAALLPPWAALGVLVAYTVVPLAAAAIVVERRDA
jgi:ABC-type transport system involved in multi-copper enzyme maturation permease subunit